MQLRSLLSSGLVLASSAAATPLEARDGTCVGDNLLKCFKNSASLASSFCSSTLSVATITAATVTNTETTVVTITGAPSHTLDVAKRAATSAAPTAPACVAGAYTYDAARITSACSCLGVTQSTASVTYTAGTATVTETAYVTVSASSTSASTTTTSAAVCASAGPAFVNGDFESGTLNGWQTLSTVNPNGLILDAAGSQAHTGSHSLHIFTNYYQNWAPQSVQQGTYLATVPGVVYKLSFWVWVGGLTPWTASINGNVFASTDGTDHWVQWSTTFTAKGQDLLVISCMSGDWQYAEFFFDDFVAAPVQ